MGSLFLLLFSLHSFAASPPYPMLVNGRGKIMVATGREEKMQPLVKQLLLREKATIELTGEAQVTLLMDQKRSFILTDGAVVRLPGISWESGEAPFVEIERGSLRWIQKEKASYSITLKSSLFEFSPKVSDFIVRIDPSRAFAEMLVVAGEVDFQAMNAETSVRIKPNEKASFQGVIEGGEIAYDVLLQGRKIPKGKLGQVEKFSKQDYEQFSEQVQREKEEILRRKRLAELAKANRLLPGQICRRPNAKLNECAWICENNPSKEKKKCRLDLANVKCIRMRCNANGEWAERSILNKDDGEVQCGVSSVVRKCDY